MNLELVRGRDFSLAQGDKKNLALISESAAARLGLADPIGEMIKLGYMSRSEMVWRRKGDEDRVVGVVKDFTFESGYEDATPGLLLLNSRLGTKLLQRQYHSSEYEADLMLVRVKPGDMQEVVQYMEETWERHRWSCRLPLLLPAAGLGSGLSRRVALASTHHVGCGRRGVHLCVWVPLRSPLSPRVAAPRRSASAKLSVPASLALPR